MTEQSSRVTSKEGLALLEKLRILFGDFPEITEGIDGFGHTSFRVNDKPLVIIGEGNYGLSFSIKTDQWTQSHLIEQGPFVKTPYIGRHGWVSLPKGAPIDWQEVRALVRQTYRLIAPKRLLKQLDAQSAPAEQADDT